MLRSRVFILLVLLAASATQAQSQTIGLFTHDAGSQDGYVLFPPLMSHNTYLIDKCGREVHTWTSTHTPGQSVYLLPDGSLLRPGSVNNTTFNAGGSGGIIERFDWNSLVTWSYTISDTAQCQHHDVCYLPNGNILAIVWQKKSAAEAIAMGRKPALTGAWVWSEKIVELQPAGASGATIVWEWHVWDHLNQDYTSSLPGYDTIANHPELINANYKATAANTDWLHINAVDYNPGLDEIMLSVHNTNEIWIIDHSTTTAEAAGHTGGNHHKGGDLLYRWGNPAAYDNGATTDQQLFGQHNAHWIAGGLTDSGEIMVFNNGQGRPGGSYSSVDVIAPPVDAGGNYSYTPGTAYLPTAAAWSYEADTPANFYGSNISGCQRLPGGNTLICVGPSGLFFEVDASKKTVWKYINPINNSGPMTQGTTPAQNLVFRCTQYQADYPGFTGHTLTAGDPLELDPLTYYCGTSGVENIVSPVTMCTVANPIANDIIIRANFALKNARLSLADITGKEAAVWGNVNISPSQPAVFAIPGNLHAGMYLLSVVAPAYTQRIKLVKE